MNILFLPNWKVQTCPEKAKGLQPPDVFLERDEYWFFKYIKDVKIDIIDIRSCSAIENVEKRFLKFYVIQAIKAFFSQKKYDVIISHGAQSGAALAMIRRLVKRPHTPHILIDVGAFNSASEHGFATRLMQFASKSLDGIVYHTKKQITFYQKKYPWLVNKSAYITFGTDTTYFHAHNVSHESNAQPYMICIGSIKRDWDILLSAFTKTQIHAKLLIVGNSKIKSSDPRVVIIPQTGIENLILLIRNSLFGILPLQSFNYSFGQMTLLQQMALGKAVVVAKVPPVEDYIDDMQNGIFYNAGDSMDLQKKIEYAFCNRSSIAEIGKNAAASIESKFNEVIMAKAFEEFLNQYSSRA